MPAAPTVDGPLLLINRGSFCTSDDDWTITVADAAPHSTVTFREWYDNNPSPGGDTTSSWNASAGTTDGSGFFQWITGPPDFGNLFIAQVVVDGEFSNLIQYQVTGGC
jgi:hypothetical protein